MEPKILQGIDTLKAALGLETKANEANNTVQAGSGNEFVTDEMATRVIQVARDQRTVLSTVPNVWQMKASTLNIPVEAADPVFYGSSELPDVPATPAATSKAGTAELVLSAKKVTANVYITGDLIEDAAIDGGFTSYVERKLGAAFAEVVDNMIVNGDVTTAGTGNVNSDDAAVAASNPTLKFNGLRKQCFTDSTNVDASVLDAADFLTVRAKIARKYALDPTKLLILMSPEVYYKLQALTQVQTLEVFGGAATILNGVLTQIYGIDILVTSQLGLTEADGKISAVTPANNVKGTFLIVYKDGMHFGWRRQLSLSFDYKQDVDQYIISAHSRLAFGIDRSAMVAQAINITVA